MGATTSGLQQMKSLALNGRNGLQLTALMLVTA